METRPLSRSWFSPIAYYTTLGWTILCFVGTWFIIFKYDILLQGLFVLGMTFLFAAAGWALPLIGLILLSLYVEPEVASPTYVPFKELIKRGMSNSLG
jgi:hypothetical protein